MSSSDLNIRFLRTAGGGGGGGGGGGTPPTPSTPTRPIPAADLFFPLIGSETHEARVMTSSRADVLSGQINSTNRTAFMRFGASVAARTAPHKQFFPSAADYVNSLGSCKAAGLTRQDITNAKKQLLKNDPSGLDPQVLQWLQQSGFLNKQFFRGPLGFTRSFSGLDDDSGLLQRIDFFGNHSAGEILQALNDAETFYGMDMKVDGTSYTITCDGVTVISGGYSEEGNVIYSKIPDDIPADSIDAALRTMIFMHCSSASSSDSNILIPEFGDNVLENIRALQIALYEAHMHIQMSATDYQNEMGKIQQLLATGDITAKHAKALEKELTYIFEHCQTFSDKPHRDINGFREIMHYPYSKGGYDSARTTINKFAQKAEKAPVLYDRAAWAPGARPVASF